MIEFSEDVPGNNGIQESKSRAPAVARAATVLRLLSRERSGLGVTEIARRVGLVPSTCFHVLRTLVDEGFVAFDVGSKTYRTGVGLFTLVQNALTTSQFPSIVQPILNDLAARHPVTAVAVELDSRERMVVVALARTDSFVSLHVNVGSSFPAFISATGRCVAAASNLSRPALQTRFTNLRWERKPRFEDWYQEVQHAKKDGFALDRGNYIRGITVMAMLLPIGSDNAVRGIGAVGLDHNMTDKSLERLRDTMFEAVNKTSSQLG